MYSLKQFILLSLIHFLTYGKCPTINMLGKCYTYSFVMLLVFKNVSSFPQINLLSDYNLEKATYSIIKDFFNTRVRYLRFIVNADSNKNYFSDFVESVLKYSEPPQFLEMYYASNTDTPVFCKIYFVSSFEAFL